MNEIQEVPQENTGSTESIRSTENLDKSRLNESTFEPGASVERGGDIQQSEGIQSLLVNVSENLIPAQPQESPADMQQAVPVDEPFTPVEQGSGGEAPGVTPVNLPPPVPGMEMQAGLENAHISVEQPGVSAGMQNLEMGMYPASSVNQENFQAGVTGRMGGSGERSLAPEAAGIIGFDTVESYLSDFRASPGGSGGASALKDGTSQVMQPMPSGDLSSGAQLREALPESFVSSGQSYNDIMNEFQNYCKDAYDQGDRPTDGDVSGWVAKQSAAFFGDKFGEDKYTDILKSLAADKSSVEAAPKITVTRLEEAQASDSESQSNEAEAEGEDEAASVDEAESEDEQTSGDEGSDGSDDSGSDVSEGQDERDTGHRAAGRSQEFDALRAQVEARMVAGEDDTGGKESLFQENIELNKTFTDSGDDTGGKERQHIDIHDKLYPDSGGSRPIDPAQQFDEHGRRKE